MNAAKGFRSGGFNAVRQPTFDPESIWSYELGAKGHFIDPRLYLEVAGFFSRYDDYQIVGIVPSLGTTVTANAGVAEIRGVDLGLVFDATEAWQLGLTGTYLDSEFTRINVTSTSHAVGDPLDMVPEYAVSAWSAYSFVWFGGSPGTFRVDYSQQGRSYFRNRSLGPDYVSQSDLVDLLNARLTWHGESLSLELYALNILNDRGYLGPIVIEQNAERAMPRTVGLQLRLDF